MFSTPTARFICGAPHVPSSTSEKAAILSILPGPVHQGQCRFGVYDLSNTWTAVTQHFCGCNNSALTRVPLAQVANLAKFMQYGFHRGEHVCASFDHVAPQADVGQATVRQEAGHQLEADIRKFFLDARVTHKKNKKQWKHDDCCFKSVLRLC